MEYGGVWWGMVEYGGVWWGMVGWYLSYAPLASILQNFYSKKSC